MQSLAVSARGLSKSYGDVEALRGVDLEVRRGEIFGFLGPNGSGKTTTIRCLLDLIRPGGGVHRLVREARGGGATVFCASRAVSEGEGVAGPVAILRRGAVAEVSETAALTGRALRRVRVRFREPTDAPELDRLAGVRVLGRDD